MRDPGSILGSGRSPGEGNGNPLQVFLPGKSMDREAWQAISPWDCKEWDTAKRQTLSGYTFFKTETLKEKSYLKKQQQQHSFLIGISELENFVECFVYPGIVQFSSVQWLSCV